MPQLDKAVFLTQMIWLLVFYNFFFVFYGKIILPRVIKEIRCMSIAHRHKTKKFRRRITRKLKYIQEKKILVLKNFIELSSFYFEGSLKRYSSLDKFLKK
jgi:hypothetical protein